MQTPLKSVFLVLAVIGLAWTTVHGAYLIEIDTDGADDGLIAWNPDFSFGGDTTAASQSAASGAVGLTGGDSIYGGNGSSLPDSYVFTYSPDTQADNLALAPETVLGDGNEASGAVGGAAGRYAVYATWPATSNVSGGLTNYLIESAGDPGDSFSFSIDQNGSGGFGNVWVKLGEIDYTEGAITVTQTATTNTGVSMRAAGVLFELMIDPLPDEYTGPPGPFVLGGHGAEVFGLAFKRSRTATASTHFSVVQSPDLAEWSTTDLKLVSITDFDAEHELVAYRSMTPMSTMDRQFLAVQAIPKMPLGDPPKYVAMTYDDGPHADRTPRLLDMLKARNIRATFYVTGLNAERHPHVLRRMINEGHEIGNHSYSHARLTDLSTEEVDAEVAGCHDSVVAAATLPPATIRPPYGAVNQTLRNQFLNDFGYPTVLWDVDPRDWDTAVPDEDVISHILTEADHGEIILTHDIHERTITSMPAILDGLLAQGFSFVTVSELLDLEGS